MTTEELAAATRPLPHTTSTELSLVGETNGAAPRKTIDCIHAMQFRNLSMSFTVIFATDTKGV